MLYTILRLPHEPIFIVRILPPITPTLCIYGIDQELLRMTSGLRQPFFRVDDFSRVPAHQFTRTQAEAWFSGAVREDARWRSAIQHVAAGESIRHWAQTLQRDGLDLHVPIFPSVTLAVEYSRVEIRRNDGER